MAQQLIDVWKENLSQKRFRYVFVFSLLTLVALLIFLTNFLEYVENRSGSVLNDPILSLFEPLDLTWLIFILIYGSIAGVIVTLSGSPRLLLTGIQTYALMIFIRIIAMYVLPLEPPVKMIPLIDPVVEIIGGTGVTLTKDLFFSGHTATLFLFFLVVEKRWIKNILLVFTFLVAFFVLLQHVHYSIDVLAAFGAVYCSYKVVLKLQSTFFLKI